MKIQKDSILKSAEEYMNKYRNPSNPLTKTPQTKALICLDPRSTNQSSFSALSRLASY